MADLLKQGSDWLVDQMKANASSLVTYRRGSDSVAVQATIGRTVFELDQPLAEIGIAQRLESRDYLIQAADLVLAGEQTLPERGDQVEEVLAGTTLTYEVMAPRGEPHWRYSDDHRRLLRIHTKAVDETS